MSRLGTISLIELEKVFGGSETNVEPALVELKKVLPKIAPGDCGWRIAAGGSPQGIVAEACLAFMAAVDNVPVSLFLSPAWTDMLPTRIWGMMASPLDVRVAAVSGILILAVFILMPIMERLTGQTRRIRG